MKKRMELTGPIGADVRQILHSAELRLTRRDIRCLIDALDACQKLRIMAGNQIKAIETSKLEPCNQFKDYFMAQSQIEKQLVDVLDGWTTTDPISKWVREKKGLDGNGVLAARLAGHIDISKVRTAGGLWRFAGLDPSIKWIGNEAARKLVDGIQEKESSPEKAVALVATATNFKEETLRRFALEYSETGKITWKSLAKSASRCPWNARLKRVCYLISDSFVKVSNRGSFYGMVYRLRKGLEVQRNEEGKFTGIAEAKLKEKKITDTKTKARLNSGKLTDKHLDQRARRYAVKMFLAHYFETGWRILYGTEPPAPYPIHKLGHIHWIKPDEAEKFERKEETDTNGSVAVEQAVSADL